MKTEEETLLAGRVSRRRQLVAIRTHEKLRLPTVRAKVLKKNEEQQLG